MIAKPRPPELAPPKTSINLFISKEVTMPHSLPETRQAEPVNWSQKQVQTFAADTATQLGYKPGADLEPIVRRLGGSIAYSDWDLSRQTGYIRIEGPGRFLIALSPLASGQRSRFTIAHELGHYILHSRLGQVSPVLITRDGSGRLEWEANWFASGFLMPETDFRRLMALGWGDASIAHHFDVSKAAVEIRRHVLQ